MAKKKSRAHQVSKGERKSTARKTTLAIKNARSLEWKMENLIKSWSKGLNPWITVNNPNKEETNKRTIRIRTNDYWGYPKPAQIKMRLS